MLNSSAILIFVLLGFAGVVMSDTSEVIIESEESKTIDDKPVFNKINWQSSDTQDVWMMNQSHGGAMLPAHEWERLAIVIDKTKTPHTARYYQLEPGPLEWPKDSSTKMPKATPYRVPCYMCHANGPRAIRPTGDISLKDKLRIILWNLKIKSYGRVVLHPDHESPPSKEWAVKWESSFMNEPLKVKACVICHKESGFAARGTLKRQHIPTIQFLVDKGHMPALGLSLSQKEKLELQNFISGF
jgi:hypothetical protein